MEFVQRVKENWEGSGLSNPLYLLLLLAENLPVQFRELPDEAKEAVHCLFKRCKTVCPHCTFAQASYRYLNNKKICAFPQPRFECPNCEHWFTVGGRMIKSRHHILSSSSSSSLGTKRSRPFQFQPPAKKLNTQFEKQASTISACVGDAKDAHCFDPPQNLGSCKAIQEQEEKFDGPAMDYFDTLPDLIDAANLLIDPPHKLKLGSCKGIQEEEKFDIRDYFDGPGSDLAMDYSTQIVDPQESDFIAKLVQDYNQNHSSAWESELM